jgi:sec-independent protein translocase protein TatA
MVSTLLPGTALLALGMPTGWEWLLLVFLALLIFGRRLPEVARGLGRSVTEFKKGLSEVSSAAQSQPGETPGRLPEASDAVARGQTQSQDAPRQG